MSSSRTYYPTPTDDLSTVADGEHYYALAVRERLDSYLRYAAPERVADSAAILRSYRLEQADVVSAFVGGVVREDYYETPSGLMLGSPRRSTPSTEYQPPMCADEVADGVDKMMADLCSFFRLPEQLAKHAFHPYAQRPGGEKSLLDVTAAYGVGSAAPEIVFRSSSSPNFHRSKAHFPDDRHRDVRLTSPEHVSYVRGAPMPAGFDRYREATCPFCGVEVLNPPELRRHMHRVHRKDPLRR